MQPFRYCTSAFDGQSAAKARMKPHVSEYENQAPRIHEIFLKETAKYGVTPNMEEFVK